MVQLKELIELNLLIQVFLLKVTFFNNKLYGMAFLEIYWACNYFYKVGLELEIWLWPQIEDRWRPLWGQLTLHKKFLHFVGNLFAYLRNIISPWFLQYSMVHHWDGFLEIYWVCNYFYKVGLEQEIWLWPQIEVRWRPFWGQLTLYETVQVLVPEELS